MAYTTGDRVRYIETDRTDDFGTILEVDSSDSYLVRWDHSVLNDPTEDWFYGRQLAAA